MSASSPNLLPVTMVAGVHREPRQRAVLELLAADPGTVVVQHDLTDAAQSGVLRRVWDDRGTALTERVPLVNGCPCCAFREDLLPYLLRIAQDGVHRRVVIELWGGSDPQPLVETLVSGEAAQRAMRDVVELVGVVAAFDPGRLIDELSNDEGLNQQGLHTGPDDERTLAEALAQQIEYAGVLATAEGTGAETAAGLAMLRQLRPAVPIVALGAGRLREAAREGFDLSAAAARVDPAVAQLPVPGEQDGVSTLVWKRRGPLHPARLYDALEQLVPAAQRSRGRFWLANRPEVMLGWEAAGASLTVEDCGPWLACLPDAEWERYPPDRRAAAALEWDSRFGDRVQLLAFTAEGLDSRGISDLLDSCLLTEEEFATGEAGWKKLPDAFEKLLDPVS